MKRKLILAAAVCICLALCGGCGSTAAVSDGTIEIKEKVFVSQTNDIYANTEDYLGKTIKLEGIFTVYDSVSVNPGSDKYYCVIRYGPGCCGYDANCGFEVVWDKEYPEDNAWVEAVGILEEYDDGGYMYLRLALSSMTIKEKRGKETVTQ
ncbi:MAG: hypothetical protein LBQ91_02145 [Oscillospiraceae bacterium]|jgi:uncharacterized membrane protein YcgQ (UPF0703/DUF1980 family)|nr:hypothetical protein [Oscillospiraceae bacterium]